MNISNMTDRNVAYFMAGIAVAVLLLLSWLLPFNGLYGQDSYEYLRFAEELHNSLQAWEMPGSFVWPVYYPLAGALVGSLTGDILWAMQFISILALAGSGLLLHYSLQLLFRARNAFSGIFIILFFFLSPFMFRAGLVLMSEMMAVSLICGALFCWLKYIKHQRLLYLLLFTFLGAATILTRYNAFIILLPLMVHTGFILMRHFKLMHLVWSLLVLGLTILPQVLLQPGWPSDVTGHYLLQNWSPAHFFRNAFSHQDGHLSYVFPNIIYAFQYLVHPGFTFLGIPLLLFFRRKYWSPPLAVVLASVLLYTFFLMGISFQNARFMVPLFPLVLLLLYRGFENLLNKVNQWKKVVYAAAIIFMFLQSVLIARALKPFVQQNHFERSLAAELELPEGDWPLYTFSVDLALKTYGLENPVRNFWYEDFQLPDSTAYVLFNEASFQDRWAGKSVMKNWQRLKQAGTLQVLDEPADGWKLYQFHPQ